jgi:hypothetical protein
VEKRGISGLDTGETGNRVCGSGYGDRLVVRYPEARREGSPQWSIGSGVSCVLLPKYVCSCSPHSRPADPRCVRSALLLEGYGLNYRKSVESFALEHQDPLCTKSEATEDVYFRSLLLNTDGSYCVSSKSGCRLAART